MQFRTRKCALAVGLALGCMNLPVHAQLPPPPPPPATLWSFLGIPQGYRAFRDGMNARGNRPGLERKPPLKAIADPKNLQSDNPAIKKAAEVKQAEDLKPQKIKAIKYLAQIGCGCYNRDGSITDALLKSMDDCTEAVRLATVQAISEAAAGEACANCKMRSCCSEEISNKLYEIAYERDETGCYLEPSERVRLAAAEALRTCCPGSDEDFVIERGPPPARGGEQPGVAPESGGERPGVVPPPVPPIGPIPTPAVPLPNPRPVPATPPAPIVPPAAAPRPPAPAAKTNPAIQSSRRTATVEPAPSNRDVAQAATKVSPLRLDPPPATPHWMLPAVERSVYFVPPVRGPLPILDPPVPTSFAFEEPVRVNGNVGVSPLVQQASLTRLPPVDAPNAENVPAPPLPPIATPAIPVSTHRAQTPAKNSGVDLPSVLSSPATPSTKPADDTKRSKPTVPMAQRQIPGARYGTGMVTSIHLKEGVALLEFANEAAVPPGSVLRAYHEYALTGNTAICDLEVVRGEGGLAAAVPRSGNKLTALSIGDRVLVLQ
jgi:hypothetical protein